MAYFSGVFYGNDEISGNNYSDDMSLFDSEYRDSIIPSTRNFSGYDYHPDGSNYKPPLSKPPPRKIYKPPPKQIYDKWRLKTPTKQREAFSLKDPITIEDPFLCMITTLIIFVTIIYFITVYKMITLQKKLSRDIWNILYSLAKIKGEMKLH